MLTREAQGMEIPAIGLGTWQLRGAAGEAAVRRALDIGYRHIDTAEFYQNEEEIGAAIAAADVDREEVFLTTKVWRTHLAADEVEEAVTGSLDRLGTGYIDLLLVHYPNEDVPLGETLAAMEELQDDGRVRHIGVSNFTPTLLDEARDLADAVACNQVEMHPYHQQQRMVKYCREHDIVLTAYSPLAQGEVVDDPRLAEIGERHGATAAQVAIAWLIAQDPVVAIPRAEDADNQRENLAAANVELADAEMDEIRELDRGERTVNPDFAPWSS